ncbi:hypothetical protein F5146DRAFT_1225613 [Armillaria mellea]|nr:hypothetical protein F5146DRAFT_1225613 [Armillaria mellea]
MGIHRPEYAARGSDPSDYEQKFPEDKRYEEMGPTARVWRTYLEECGPFDLEMVEGWRDALDVLLVFAGLFSAVVTTFVAQTSQSLQAANGSLVNGIPHSDLTFRPSVSDSWVNGLWFTSLSLSLSTALFAVLTKQWIHQYMSVPSGIPQDRCRLRQFRYMGLQRWGVDLIIGLLPVLMSASLAAFLVGLVLFIIPLSVSIASVVGSVTFIAFAAYLITNFLPILYPSCPYKTPLSQYIFPLYAYITHNISFKWIKVGADTQPDKPSPIPRILLAEHLGFKLDASESLPEPVTLQDAEIAAVKHCADETDVHALSWLYSMSSNPSVQSIVIQSTSALPLTSVTSLPHHIAYFPFTCQLTLRNLLLDASNGHPALEGKIDRVSRAFLRFPGKETEAHEWRCGACVPFDVTSHLKGYFSPDVYAQLLELLRSNFLSNLSLKGIELEPIVWARLFHKILPYGPDDRDMVQYFFSVIPTFNWRARFVSSPPVYEWGEVQIFQEAESRPARLLPTLYHYLDHWVEESIIQRQLDVIDSVFNPESPDDYPSPQDPRLRFLLTMAGSPSIQRTGIDEPLGNIFCKAIRGIEYIFGSRIFGTPCDHFGKREWTPRPLCLRSCFGTGVHQTWLQSLSGSSLRMVTWATIHTFDNHDLKLYALIDHLVLHFPLIVNEAFEYATAKRLFDCLVENPHYNYRYSPNGNLLNSYHPVRQSLKMFITGSLSSKSESQISQNFLKYLHEPDVLFAVCTFLVGGGFRKSLHDLASLCPNEPAWPVCLQRLREYVYLPAEVPDGDDIPGILADLTTFLEGGGVGPFGSTAPPTTEHIAQVYDSLPVNLPKDPWLECVA